MTIKKGMQFESLKTIADTTAGNVYEALGTQREIVFYDGNLEVAEVVTFIDDAGDEAYLKVDDIKVI